MTEKMFAIFNLCIEKFGMDYYQKIIKESYSVVFAVFSFVSIFVPVETYLGVAGKMKIMMILCLLIIPAVIGYLVAMVKEKCAKKCCKKMENGEFVIEYGDLHELMFPAVSPSDEYTVVIPVNNRLNEVATMWEGSKGRSNHGFWLNTIFDRGKIAEQDLRNLCKEKLETANVYNSNSEYEYPAGTCILLRGNEIGQENVNIILAATGGMTQGKQSYSTEEQFIAGIQGIINMQIEHLYSVPLYLPIVSGGFAGAKLKKSGRTLIEMMYRIFEFNEDMLHSDVHVVVYEKERDKISIFI